MLLSALLVVGVVVVDDAEPLNRDTSVDVTDYLEQEQVFGMHLRLSRARSQQLYAAIRWAKRATSASPRYLDETLWCCPAAAHCAAREAAHDTYCSMLMPPARP